MTLRYVARTQIQAQVGGRQGRTEETGVEQLKVIELSQTTFAEWSTPTARVGLSANTAS